MRALVLLALLAVSGAAHADDRAQRIPQQAREAADRGRALHDAGAYAQAVAAYKEAYVLAPSPGLLFNIAQAYRLDGNCDEAAWMYHRFLDSNPSPERRAVAENHLQAVEKCGHGGLRITVLPPALDVPVPEPKPEAAKPEPAKLEGPSGNVAIVAAPAAPQSSQLKRIGKWLGIGGGVALVGASLFALDANDAANTVADTYRKGGKWSDIAATDARGQRSAELATVLGVGGGAAAITSIVCYFAGRHAEQLQHVAVTPSVHGAEVRLTWGF